jgi:hypothetical protein
VHFLVEVLDGNLFVNLPNGSFKATYYKPARRPHLILRERTKTDDHELLVEALQGCGSQGARAGVDCVRLGFGRRPFTNCRFGTKRGLPRFWCRES